MAEVAVYRCDICHKEHRRTDEIIHLELTRKWGTSAIWRHICFDCETVVKELIKERNQKKDSEDETLMTTAEETLIVETLRRPVESPLAGNNWRPALALFSHIRGLPMQESWQHLARSFLNMCPMGKL